MKIQDILTISPDVQFGTPVFKGTRVPATYLMEFLEDGLTIGQFIEEFPSVKYQQVIELLKWTNMFLHVLHTKLPIGTTVISERD